MKKMLTVFTAFFLAVLLCGCTVFSDETAGLLAPPALTGNMYAIQQALTKSVKGSYNLSYPSGGDYRSAIIEEDITGSGTPHAFAFYSTAENEVITMHVNVMESEKGEWSSVSEQTIAAAGVDRVDFCDLDGDGTEEILVGWEIYGSSELQVAVYSLSEQVLTQRMLENYTRFVPCDLDENGIDEVLIINVSSAEEQNYASLFTLSDQGVFEVSTCGVDNNSKTLSEPVVSTLSTGKPAVYIDEVKGVGSVTEVFFLEKGQLQNPLFDQDAKETIRTLRSATLKTRDINEDNIPEIPIWLSVPAVAKSNVTEKLYLTQWCSFNGEVLTPQITAMQNEEDGYYYIIPNKWLGKIAVIKDTDSHLREIYRYDSSTSTVGKRLMYIKAVKKKDWDEGQYEKSGTQEIMNDGETTYLLYLTDLAVQDGITLDKVKSDFHLFE